MVHRLGIRLADDAYEALLKEAEEKGMGVGQHVRNILDDYLKGQGIEVKSKVQWGGYRPKAEDDQTN